MSRSKKCLFAIFEYLIIINRHLEYSYFLFIVLVLPILNMYLLVFSDFLFIRERANFEKKYVHYCISIHLLFSKTRVVTI